MTSSKSKEDLVDLSPKIFRGYVRILKRRNSYYNKSFAWEWAEEFLDKRVLDAGCGEGSTLARREPPLTTVLGIDPLFEALKDNSHVAWRAQGVVEELPFRSETFDAIYCDSVFEHINDADRTCREFFRVLKPGGKVLINTNSIFNPFMFPNKFLSIRARERLKEILHIQSEGTFPAPYRANTKARLRRYLTRSGFRNLQFYRWGLPGMVRPKWFLALELCMELLSEIPLFCGLKHRLMVTAEKTSQTR